MATHQLTVAGVDKTIQQGWSMQQSANGRDTLQCEIVSVDGSYRPAIGAAVTLEERVLIASSSVANPTIVTTAEPHGIVSGMLVGIGGHTSTPNINGWSVATRINATQFSVPFNVTVAGGATGYAARRIFGGRIESPAEAGAGGIGLTPITTRIEAASYDAQTERRVWNGVLAAGTEKSQLATLAADTGLTLHPAQVDGPTLGALPCDYATLRDILENRSVVSGDAYEIDPHDYLRMFPPASEAAPFDVIAGDGHAIGDLTVTPSRSGYANRAILKFTAAAIKAYGFHVATANYTSGETVAVGGQTYQFRLVLTNVAGYVLIGADAQESLANLCAAITLDTGSGVKYAALTTLNGSVTAYPQSTDAICARALTAGASGNSIASTTTAANAFWGSATLVQGADAALTNVSIATDASWATDPWDVVIQSPETTDQASADILSAAYLAAHLVEPDTVQYDTLELGARPSQTQTITEPMRDIDGTFLITDVSTRSSSACVLRTVTAIESLLVNAADRWQDSAIYRGGVGGSALSIGGITIGGGSDPGSAAPVVISLGGDRFHGVQL